MAVRIPSGSGSGSLSRMGLAATAAAGGKVVQSSKQEGSWTALAAGGASGDDTDEDEEEILRQMDAATDKMARALQVAQSFTARPAAPQQPAGQLIHTGSTSHTEKPTPLRISREAPSSPGRSLASATRSRISFSEPRSSDTEQLSVDEGRQGSGSSQHSSMFWTPSSSLHGSRSSTSASFQAIPASLPTRPHPPPSSHLSDGGVSNSSHPTSFSGRMSAENIQSSRVGVAVSWSEGGAKQIKTSNSVSRVRFSDQGLRPDVP